MWYLKVVPLLYALLVVEAVVNGGSGQTSQETDASLKTTGLTPSEAEAVDANDKNATRREASLGLSDSYGVPIPNDSYGVPSDSLSNIPSLPVPVYGVPDAPSNNIVYPGPPPDIPPPLPSNSYGVPKQTYGVPIGLPKPSSHGHGHGYSQKHRPSFNLPSPVYGPPKPVYGPPKPVYGPPSLSKPIFNLPSKHPKPSFILPPKPNYGPPKLHYGPPKHTYGPPKQIFNPPKAQYGVPKPISSYGPPPSGIPRPHSSYGPPPSQHYGIPDPVPHGPPHPGAPAPPTPPDIKYDGWQPIPGLVSRPPSDTYGVPANVGNDIHFKGDYSSQSFGGGSSFSSSFGGISDSYGAPLNTVTGSGGVIGSSVTHGSSGDDLSVIKSIGFELFPNSHDLSGPSFDDSYKSPPLSSYSADGPYAASHSHSSHGISSHSFGSFKSIGSSSSSGLKLSSNGIGLTPPSGVYGVPPGGRYETSVISGGKGFSSSYKVPSLNVLDINPPKQPVVFREPVPHGLIESIGHGVAQKDALGIQNSQHSSFQGTPYIPPPIPDITKVKHIEPIPPSNLYSLPTLNNPVSFQSISFGLSGAGGGLADLSSFSLATGPHASGYTAPTGPIDSYGVPLQQIPLGFDQSHAQSLTRENYDLTGSYAIPHLQTVPHDCSLHRSQPLPAFTYTLPSNTGYLSSGIQNTISQSYGGPDLHASHSQKSSVSSQNLINENSHSEIHGKALASINLISNDSQVQKSHSIDINNIPLTGSLGQYTLQIQPSDGSSTGEVPHQQVLNDGLLQTILAAIEQPQQQQQQQQPLNIQNQYGVPTYETSEDSEGANTVTRETVVTSPAVNETSIIAAGESNDSEPEKTEQETTSVNEVDTNLLDNNDIAIYFNNDHASQDKSESDKTAEDKEKEIRNGQQYGSYVSFRTPTASYAYSNEGKPSETNVQV